MKIDHSNQKDKLETLFIHSPASTLGSVQIWFRAGSALENKSNEGIAHFLEHMFFKGTKKRPGSKIASDVESFGGEINAFTSFDYTCYYINCPDDKIIESADILLDMVSNPRFLQKELEPEREVVFEEYRRSIDNSNQYSFMQIQKNIFTGTYSHPILGREKTIKNFTRKQLLDFRKENYNLKNAFLIVAGDLETDKKLKLKLSNKIKKMKLPHGKESSFSKFKLVKSSKANLHFKDVEMGQITVCFQAPPQDTKEAALEDLAVNCLGHGRSSILYKNLVLNETLANSCSASSMFMRDGGFHVIRLNSPVENIDKVLKEFDKVITKVKEEGFSDHEIEKIKNQYLASKIYDKESIENFSFSIGHSLASTKEIRSEDIFIERISSATTKETNKALNDVLNRNIEISVQLPLDQKDKKDKWKTTIERYIKNYQTKFQKVNKNKSNNLKINKKFIASKFDKQAKLYQINDQIQLFHKKNEIAETFVLHAYVQGGLTTETKDNNGIHSLIGQMLSKGYSDCSYEDLQKDLDFKAAGLSGFSGKNAYGLTSHGLSIHFEEVLGHLTGSLFDPSFHSDNLKHERELTLRSLEVAKKDPVKQCFQQASEFFFNQHPYAFELLGTEDNVANFTKDQLKQTHQNNLKNGKIIFSYSGNFDVNTVMEKILESFPTSILENKSFKSPSKKSTTNSISPIINEQKHITFDREQTQIFVGFPTGKLTDKEHLYLKMLSSFLGGQSSPLFVDVRDKKGLCYTAQPVHFSALEAGYWGIYMASGFEKVEKAKQAIFDLLKSIQINGLNASEFKKVKSKIAGSQKLELQTNSDFINFYTINSLHQLGLDYFHKQIKNIEKTTHQDFQKNIKKILSRSMSVVTVGK